jgi:hypothetical protein
MADQKAKGEAERPPTRGSIDWREVQKDGGTQLVTLIIGTAIILGIGLVLALGLLFWMFATRGH